LIELMVLLPPYITPRCV